MLEIINPIMRSVHKEDITDYLNQKFIDYRDVNWDVGPNLIGLEIEKLLNKKYNNDKKDQVLSEFSRIIKLAKESNEFIYKSFFLFLKYRKEFEKKEIQLHEDNKYKKFLQNILTNEKLLGGLFFLISFSINLAQICSDEDDARFIALNIFHFILGGLAMFYFNKNGWGKE